MRRSGARAAPALLLALALVAAAPPARAEQSDDIAHLREEAAALRQRLDALDAKIRALEGENGLEPRPAAPAASRDGSPVSLRQSWAEVRPGLAKERVHALLGDPVQVMHIDGDLVWYYVYPAGPGSVFFNSKETVTSVQAPRTGLW